MPAPILMSGRPLTSGDLEAIRQVIAERPDWSRWSLSRELARRMNWVTPRGQLKDMACRDLLIKLDRQGLAPVPRPKRKSPSPTGRGRTIEAMSCETTPIQGDLVSLQPIKVEQVSRGTEDDRRIRWLLESHHYLGLNRTTGATIRYLLKAFDGRLLGCALWGCAAWMTAPRDRWIGWTKEQRARGLQSIVNNNRFLVLPWVAVPNLASHALGLMARRLPQDFWEVYGVRVVLMETFVDSNRYAGTCYKAAGWLRLGETTGRTRQGRTNEILSTRKSIFVKPLRPDWREQLLSKEN